jgi:hypothetical protein
MKKAVKELCGFFDEFRRARFAASKLLHAVFTTLHSFTVGSCRGPKGLP